MASKKFYLRPHFQAEQDTKLTYPIPWNIRDLGEIAHEYKLGCSASLSHIVLSDSFMFEYMFDDESVGIRDRAVPSDSSDAAWKFSSRSIYGDLVPSFSPAAETTLIDGNNVQYGPHHFGRLVLGILKDNAELFAQKVSDKNENFYLMDFMTGQTHLFAQGGIACVE